MGLFALLKRFRRDANGIASLEFVIFLFPMLLMFFAMIQFGSLFYNYNTMQNAARDAARRLATDSDVVPINPAALVNCPGPAAANANEETAESIACGLINLPGTPQVTACYDNVEGAAGAPTNNGATPRMDANVTIRVPMENATLVDLIGVGQNKFVTAQASIRIEEPKIFGLDPVNDDNCP